MTNGKKYLVEKRTEKPKHNFSSLKIKILGHSLGGAIGFLYTASYSDEVEALISLDIANPSLRNVVKTVKATGVQVDRFLKYENLTLDNIPCCDYAEIINIVEDVSAGGITRESAEILMRRGMQLAPSSGSHYFCRDHRLKTSMHGYLNIRAIPGMKFDQPENYQIVLGKIKESAKSFESKKRITFI